MKKAVFILLIIFYVMPVLTAQLKPGDKAVDFSLKNIDSKTVSLSEYSDMQGVILMFTCNSCPFSTAYEERIIKIHNFFGPKGYPVIAINPNDDELSPDDSFEKMQIRAREREYPFPYLKDETQKVCKAYGATRTPQIFLLSNSGGTYTVAFTGAIDNNALPKEPGEFILRYLENAIAKLMKGEAPDPAVVKAIGCTIKSKS